MDETGASVPLPHPDTASEVALRAIAYSMDALIPGIYLWWGAGQIRIGGSQPEPNYTGTIHDIRGAAIAPSQSPITQ